METHTNAQTKQQKCPNKIRRLSKKKKDKQIQIQTQKKEHENIIYTARFFGYYSH